MNNIIDNVSTVSHDDLPSIADKAVLVKLERSPMQTSKKMDEATQEEVRELVGDESAVVKSHLFQEAASPVRQLIRMDGQAYRWHKKNTLPWVDTGPRMLVGAKIDYYMANKDPFRDDQEAFLTKEIVPNWDALVQRDIQFRQQAAMSHPSPKREQLMARITIDEYPTVEEIAAKFKLEFTMRFLPNTDARVQLSKDVVEQAQADLRKEMNLAVREASKDIALRMLEPLKKAAEKLSTPIGEKGSVFRDSLVENLYDTLQEVESFQFSDNPELADAITQAKQYLHGQMPSAEALRNTQQARDEAVNSLQDLNSIFRKHI